jgi:hypothetical protein
MELTKREVAKALGVESDAAVARYFGISRSAVTQWGDSPIPEVRVLQLQLNAPELVARIKVNHKNAQTSEVERAQKRRKRG